jgi:hypothetical protein
VTQSNSTEDTFTLWRRSYRTLRLLESELVRQARSGEDPAVIARMYEKVDVLRSQTSELVHLAQTASMTHQIPVARLTAMTLDTTASEFGALSGQ